MREVHKVLEDLIEQYLDRHCPNIKKKDVLETAN